MQCGGSVAEQVGRCASLAARGSRRCLQADPAGTQAAQLPAGRDAAPQADRPPRLRQRRAVLGGLRPGRDLHHAGRGRGLGVRLVVEDRPRRRPGDAHGGGVLPADRARLPQRRRRLRGRDRQPRRRRAGDHGRAAPCSWTTCSPWPCRSPRPSQYAAGGDPGAGRARGDRRLRARGRCWPASTCAASASRGRSSRSPPTSSCSRSSACAATGCMRLLAGDLPEAESADLIIDPAAGWEGPLTRWRCSSCSPAPSPRAVRR